MIDFHTHILPNMDDGSDSVNTSIELLKQLESEGVKLVCLTSHFYPKQESIDDFIIRRNNAFSKLNYNGDLDLRLGSEIHYYRGISTSEDIGKLCIENTRILLIELSFSSPINENVIKELVNLKNRGFVVILAHIERYDIGKEMLIEMHNKGILFQVNTEAFDGLLSRNRAIKWLKKGLIDVLGSDTHNNIDRMPNYDKAINIIKNKLGEAYYREFVEKTYNIIREK